MQEQVSFRQALDRKNPRELAIAIARDPQGKYNPITLGMMTFVSHGPPMAVVSVQHGHHSIEAFRTSREFVVAFPSESQADETMLYGTKSGRDTDKLAEAGANTQPAAKIDCVLLADAVANFECKLVGEMETGDHILFVGEVVCSHMNPEPVRRLYIKGPGHVLSGLPGGSP